MKGSFEEKRKYSLRDYKVNSITAKLQLYPSDECELPENLQRSASNKRAGREISGVISSCILRNVYTQHIIQIQATGILLFCYIDNRILFCYPLPISRFFYFKISISASADVCDFGGIPA